MSPQVGLRVAVGDLDDAEDAEGQGGPADDLAAGRAGVLGVAHRAPADEEQHERDQRSRPCRPSPATTVRAASMTDPGSCHQTAAATTTAEPKRKRPTPSRRCSGSRSRAVCPMLRATAPSAVRDRQPDRGDAAEEHGEEPRATGPGPLRTARGAGRFGAGARWDGVRGLALARGSSWGQACASGWYSGIAVLAARLCAGLREVLAVRVEDVLLLRDPGGEDVRVAMVPTLRRGHSSHTRPQRVRVLEHAPVDPLGGRCRSARGCGMASPPTRRVDRPR